MLITAAADGSLIFFSDFSEKIMLDISCELTAEKCQVLFNSENNDKRNLECRLLQFSFLFFLSSITS